MPAVRPQDRAEDAHRGGLAGAVWAQQAEDGANGDLEIDALESLELAEVLLQAFNQNRSVVHMPLINPPAQNLSDGTLAL